MTWQQELAQCERLKYNRKRKMAERFGEKVYKGALCQQCNTRRRWVADNRCTVCNSTRTVLPKRELPQKKTLDEWDGFANNDAIPLARQLSWRKNQS